MGEDVGVVAAGLLQGVGEDGQVGEAPLLVDHLSKLGDGGVVPVTTSD